MSAIRAVAKPERVAGALHTSPPPEIITHHHTIEFTVPFAITAGPSGPERFGLFLYEILHWEEPGREF